MRAKLSEGQRQLGLLEDEVKELAAAIHRGEDAKTLTKQYVDELRGDTDAVTGTVKEEALDKFKADSGIPSDVKDMLVAEIIEDKQLENEWKDVQKGLEARYVRVYKEYKDAEETYNNAIRVRQQQQQQPVQNVGATAVLDSVNAAVSKSTLKSRSINSRPRGTTSPPSAVALPFQAPLFPQENGDEAAEDHEALLSPSVDMLLPKNLFGTDDLTESFATLLNGHEMSHQPVIQER
jgi:hypothetical protein